MFYVNRRKIDAQINLNKHKKEEEEEEKERRRDGNMANGACAAVRAKEK